MPELCQSVNLHLEQDVYVPFAPRRRHLSGSASQGVPVREVIDAGKRVIDRVNDRDEFKKLLWNAECFTCGGCIGTT